MLLLLLLGLRRLLLGLLGVSSGLAQFRRAGKAGGRAQVAEEVKEGPNPGEGNSIAMWTEQPSSVQLSDQEANKPRPPRRSAQSETRTSSRRRRGKQALQIKPTPFRTEQRVTSHESQEKHHLHCNSPRTIHTSL